MQKAGYGIVYVTLLSGAIVIGRPIAETIGWGAGSFIGVLFITSFILFNLWKTGRI